MNAPVNKAAGGIMSIIEDEGDSYEDRTPENIEILSNNLRGDVRSMDDRYAELAQMVGEEQAAQTPPEVVALFQTKMTQQQPMPPVPAAKANGIAGLMGGGQQAPQQGAPGQPPMPPQGQMPMPPGPPPMPPGAPPTPTGEPPVQRQLGSGPSGEMGDPGENFGNFRINVTGVGDDRRDLQREGIAPITGIPEVIAQTPSYKEMPIGGPYQQGNQGTFSIGMLPELQSADSFVDGYQSQGGDIGTLFNFMVQPEPEYRQSTDAISEYLSTLSNDPMLAEAPRPVRPAQGIESLGQETPAISPADMATIDDVAAGFTNLQDPITPSANPAVQQAQAAQRSQKKQNVSSSFSGAGLGKLLAGLGAAFGGSKKDKRDPIDQYLRMMAFASPRNTLSDGPDDYLEMFGKLPGDPDKISAFDNIPNATGAPSSKSNVEVFPVSGSNIGVKALPPQNRAKGSGPQGERIEPTFGSIRDVVGQGANGLRANDPFNLPSRGVPAMPPVTDAFVNPPKSRPFTPDELAALVTEKERKAMSPATRTLYELARQKGIDPVILTKRINDFSGAIKKLPGIGKLFKSASAFSDAFNSLSTGKKAAVVGGTGTAAFTAGALLRPNDGVVPPVPPSQFGVEQIPTEYDTPTPTTPPGDGAPPDIGKPLEIDMFPGLNRERDVRLGMDLPDAADNEYNRTKGMDLGEVLGPRLPETDEEPEITKATDTARTALGVTAKPGDDDYEAQIRKRAEIYQRLLGDDPNDRQMKAYLLLAEAGLKMMSTKGRSFGEIMGKSLQGLPSGLGQISADSSKIRRAAISAAISDVNAQKLQETKSAASLATALARTQASQLPRTQKIMGNFNLLTQHYGFPADNPLTEQVATGLVDGTITTDKRGNLRGPTGEVIPRFGYGPANQPLKEDEAGFIPNDNPFLQDAPVRPTPIVDEKGMMDADAQIYNLQKSLGYLQAAKRELGNVVGPMNVLQRGISSVTQPILGDLGPFTAFAASRGNVVDRANRSIQEIVALNPERVSVYEQEQNAKLQIDKNAFFNSPQIELAKVLRFETELVNEINKLKYRLNPEGGIKQMRVPNLGTKDDPLQTQAFPALGEYFKAQPGAKVYWQDQNGKIHALTKQQYESGMKR